MFAFNWYLTGKDLEYKPRVLEKVKFQYSPLGEALKNINAKSKKDKIVKKDKEDKHFLVYNQQHSFAKFKDTSDFKEMSLDSMHKKLNAFHKKFIKFKKVSPQTEPNKYLKAKILDNAGDLFIELYYIYKKGYEEEKDGLKNKDKRNLATKN